MTAPVLKRVSGNSTIPKLLGFTNGISATAIYKLISKNSFTNSKHIVDCIFKDQDVVVQPIKINQILKYIRDINTTVCL